MTRKSNPNEDRYDGPSLANEDYTAWEFAVDHLYLLFEEDIPEPGDEEDPLTRQQVVDIIRRFAEANVTDDAQYSYMQQTLNDALEDYASLVDRLNENPEAVLAEQAEADQVAKKDAEEAYFGAKKNAQRLNKALSAHPFCPLREVLQRVIQSDKEDELKFYQEADARASGYPTPTIMLAPKRGAIDRAEKNLNERLTFLLERKRRAVSSLEFLSALMVAESAPDASVD